MAAKFSFGRRPKRFKWLRRFAIALVLYGLIGFFIVPAVIKWQMLKRLPGLTKRQAAVRQVKFNPFAISLTIRGFSLKEPDGQVFSAFDEFYVNFNPISSVFHWAPVFKNISLVKPFGQITLLAGGKFNFSNLFEGPPPATPAPPSTPGPPPRIYIDHLSVSNGLISLDDLSGKEPFHSEFGPINFNLTNFTTIRDQHSPYAFMARTDSGETFAWSGSVGVNPPRSAGIFRLAGLKFGKYSHYSHDYSRFQIAGGMVEVAANYRFDSGSNALDLQVSNAAVHLTGLELKSPDTGETVIAIPALAITDAEADLLRQTARVGLIKSSGGSFLVRQEKDGILNLISLLILPTNAPAKVETATNAPASAPPPPPWKAKIDEIAFDDYAIRIEDKMPDKPARFNVDQISFDIKGVSNETNAPVTASLLLRYQGSGFVAVNGTATLMPPSADLQLNLTNVDLRPIQPYVEGQVRLALTGGALDLHGRAQYASRAAGAPLVDFTGNLVLNRFDTTDDVLYKDFAKWDSLSVDGLKVDLQPEQLHADQVKFTGLSTSLAIGPDRRVNLQTILRNQLGSTNAASNAVAVAAAPPSTTPPKIIPMTVDAFVLENASLHYSDESLEPHVGFDVQELNGSIKGLSSDVNATATVDFQGRVDARSPFSITGKINPLSTNLFVDVTIAVTNTELTAFSPYSEKYVGRPLQKGKFSYGAHYFIENKALKAENGIYIDQLTLGAKNDSPDATSLPVKLAIALLKDRNGRIQLNIPVEGRIDDPKFKIWPVVWHVVDNLLVKVATSPFSLLGAAFGGGEELSFVEFEPGHAELSETETKKLDTLAKALFERPTLSLEINGSVDPTADRLPLARLRLEQQLKTLYVKELTDSGKPAVSIDQINLDPDEHARLLKKLYLATLGAYQPTPVSTNAATGMDTNSIAAQLAALPPSPKDKHGAAQLMTPWKKETPAPKPALPAAGSRQTTPAVPLTRTELELADREDQLMRQMQITGDDFRDLMQRRAAQVQAYLLKTEKVTVDRLFIIVPKTVDASFKGQDRANLSLD
jgi:Domain of Unknown Function (DUF748)